MTLGFLQPNPDTAMIFSLYGNLPLSQLTLTQSLKDTAGSDITNYLTHTYMV